MGPLKGLRVIEFAGIGPGPFCAMMLADMGADVIRVDRPGGLDGAGLIDNPRADIMNRGRRSIALDLKKPEAKEIALRLLTSANALIEGYRPGVMEKLGLGPDDCFAVNPKLIYGRVTGWGQYGPLSQAAGHDINYIALTGALHGVGKKDQPPVPPLNLIGDFGGGAMMLAFGLMCAIYESQQSGKGQVIDAAMTDGAAALMTMIYGMQYLNHWVDQRESNFLDGGAHFYGTYECADGKYIALGSIEEPFYRLLLEQLGVDDLSEWPQFDRRQWPVLKEKLAAIIKTRTRDQWCEMMEGTDSCFAPVLDLEEAPKHPHNRARHTFVEIDGLVQPAPAPRYSRTAGEVSRPPPIAGEHSEEVLREAGLPAEQIDCLIGDRIVSTALT